MKVKELIKQLKLFDQDLDVYAQIPESHYCSEDVSVELYAALSTVYIRAEKTDDIRYFEGKRE